MEAFMRAHHLIAVVTILIAGLAAKQFLIPAKKAEANLNGPTAGMDIAKIEHDANARNLPVQAIRDMTFVFDSK
jgi:hypothetical protein